MKVKLELSEKDLNEVIIQHFAKEGKIVKTIKINFGTATNYQETNEWTVFRNIEVELEES